MTERKVKTTRIRYDQALEEYQVLAYDQDGRRFAAADYFTDDRDDAKATAAAMVEDQR